MEIPKKIQTAIDVSENTVKTGTGKIKHRKFISGPVFQTEKKNRKDTTLTNAEITPENQHCLRGLDGKYGRWDEILREILNGKLKIVENRKQVCRKPKIKMMIMKKCRKKPASEAMIHRSGMVGTSRHEPTPKKT